MNNYAMGVLASGWVTILNPQQQPVTCFPPEEIPRRVVTNGEFDAMVGINAELMIYWASHPRRHTPDDLLLFWRWAFVSCWTAHQFAQTGSSSFVHTINGQAYELVMHPGVMRFFVADTLESVMLSILGGKEGTESAIRMYSEMIDQKGGALTPLGLTAVEKLTALLIEDMEAMHSGENNAGALQ